MGRWRACASLIQSTATELGPSLSQGISAELRQTPKKYRRLGGESDREILMAPACVILRLRSGMRIALLGLGLGLARALGAGANEC